jgi:hypothetical protein
MIAVWACSPLIGVQRTRPTGDRQQQARAFDDRRAHTPAVTVRQQPVLSIS